MGIKNELWRMVHSRLFWIALGAGVLMAAIDIAQNAISVYEALTYWQDDKSGYEPVKLFVRWIGVNMDTVGYAWFFLLFPLLAALPYSWSYRGDVKSGFLKNVAIRTGRARYFCSKTAAVFLSGGICTAGPLTLNLLCSACFMPDAPADVLGSLTPIWNRAFLSELFYTHPWAYSWLYLATAFLWGGTIACLGLAFGFLFRQQLLGVAAPLVLFMALDYGSSFAEAALPYIGVESNYTLSPLRLLHASAVSANPAWLVYTEMLIFLLAALAIIFYGGMRSDIF